MCVCGCVCLFVCTVFDIVCAAYVDFASMVCMDMCVFVYAKWCADMCEYIFLNGICISRILKWTFVT